MPSPASEQITFVAGDTRSATLELEVPAVVESVDLVQDLVADLIASTSDDLDFTDRMRFETALIEIIGNVIEHGVPAAGRPVTMQVSLQRSDRDLSAVVTEDGVLADVDIESAVLSDSNDEDDEHGRGLAMARTLATELRYDRDGDRNRWTVRCAGGA